MTELVPYRRAGERDIAEILVKRFINQFGSPDVPSPKHFIDEYVRALSGTGVVVLEAAVSRLIDSHGYRNWPLVSECLQTVRDIAEMRADKRLLVQHAESMRVIDADLAAKTARIAAQTASAMAPEAPKPIAAVVAEALAVLRDADKHTREKEKRGATWVPCDRNAWEARFGKGPKPNYHVVGEGYSRDTKP